MVTHGHPAPREMDDLLSDIPTSRLCFFDAGLPRPGWLDQAIEAGSLVFADVGWDDTSSWNFDELRERLSGVYAFVPNATEAMAYTRTESPGAALGKLCDLVPLAVVTAGNGGAFAADAETGETAWVPAVPVEVLDPTGAGDVFLSALMVGTAAATGRCSSGSGSPTCARASPSATSVARSPRPAGVRSRRGGPTIVTTTGSAATSHSSTR